MKRTTIFIDEQLERDVRALARRQRRSAASVVREALAAYVAKASTGRTRVPSFVAAGGSGQRDVADRHEELLWSDPRATPAPETGDPGKTIGRRRRPKKGSA